MLHSVLRRIVRLIQQLVGRRRLAKLLRLATNEVRLDVGNRIGTNGETLVQDAALASGDAVVFDVGAHHGEWSRSLLDRAGARRPIVHSFEPSSASFATATRNLEGRASLHNVALSDAVGVMELQIVADGAGANSLVKFTQSSRAVGRVEQVEVSTVDEMCRRLSVDRISLLKIDAEGHDLAVLRGAQGMLEKRAIAMVQFEYNSRWIDARGFLLDAFNELRPHGYEMGKVTPQGVEAYDEWHPELEKFVEANYLAWIPSARPRLTIFPWWGP